MKRICVLFGSLALFGCKSSTPQAPADAGGPVAEAAASSASALPAADGGSGFPVPKAAVDKSLNPSDLPKYSGPVGVVEGTVFVTGDAPPATPSNRLFGCPGAERDYGTLFRESKSADGKRTLGDAIVAITGMQLMSTLDGTIVIVALPRMQAELGLSDATVRVLIHRASRKLGTSTRAETLAKFAALAGPS